jgi:hypothetical protein
MRDLVPSATRLCATLLLITATAAHADPSLPWPGFKGDPARGFIDERASVAKHLYMFGAPARWKTPIAWRYNDTGRPQSLDIDTTTGGIIAAAQKWMDVCRVSIVRGDDTTSVPQNMDGTNTSPGENVVGWGDLTLGANGSATTSAITWDYEGVGATITEFDLTFSSTFVTTPQALASVALHEWGHALGLAHSNVPAAVMSGPDSISNPGVPPTNYTSLTALTDDDKHGCLCLYGPSDALAGQGYLCGLPPVATMAATPVDATSAPFPVTLTNSSTTGTLTIDAVTFSSAEIAGAGGCAAGTKLGPGATCSFNLLFSPKGAAGVRDASYVTIATTNGVGKYVFPVTATATAGSPGGGNPPPPPPPAAPLARLAPTILTFGSVAIGTVSAPATAAVTNAGGGTVTVTAITPEGGNADFVGGGGTCGPGVVLAAGASCTVVYRFAPQSAGPQQSVVEVATDNGTLSLDLVGTGAIGDAETASVVEYYNAALDHYFITASPIEMAVLDAGQIPGWSRTGYSFPTYLTQRPGTSPVCRYYIPPALGNSHFYSVLPSECNAIPQSYPTFELESLDVMYMTIPDATTGACPSGTLPVYRLWNARADTNHRYTIDPLLRAAMVARGYVSEGYGPQGVGMCAPQ